MFGYRAVGMSAGEPPARLPRTGARDASDDRVDQHTVEVVVGGDEPDAGRHGSPCDVKEIVQVPCEESF